MPDIRYGAHELAVKQAAQVSSVWPSVRAAAAVATRISTAFITTSHVIAGQAVFFQPTPQVFTSLGTTQGDLVQRVFSEPQVDPRITQTQVFKSAATTIITSANRRLTFFTTGPQPDPTQAQPAIYTPTFGRQASAVKSFISAPQSDPTQTPSQIQKSQPAVIIASADRRLTFILSAPQADPTQIAPQVFRSLRTIPYAVRTWVTSAPQADPTQIPSLLIPSQPAAPIILGPTVRGFITPGQPDLNINYTKFWTPSTFSASAEVIPGTIVVPQFVGMLLTYAAQQASDLGFTNILAYQRVSNQFQGIVIAQNYPYGSVVPANIDLTFTVAEGSVPSNTIDERLIQP